MDNSRAQKIKLFFLILFIMLSTCSGLVTINTDRLIARISWILIIVLFVFLLAGCFKGNAYRISKKVIVWTGLFSISLICTMLFSEKAFNVNYFQRIILLASCVLIVCKYNFFKFMDSYVCVMRVLAIVSLLGMVFQPFILSSSLFPSFYSSHIEYKWFFLCNVSSHLARNFGPFWEPGAYQIFLNVALFYLFRFSKKVSVFDIGLFALTVLTTKSTTGILVLGLIFVYYLFDNKFKPSSPYGSRSLYVYNKKIKLCIIFAGIAVVFYLISSPDLIWLLFDKISSFIQNSSQMNSSNVSMYVRFYGIFANVELFLQKPLFGWGIEGVVEQFEKTVGFTSNTCTFLAFASTYGIIPFIFYCRLLFGAVKVEKGFIKRVIYIAIFVVILFTENLLVSFMFWIILLYDSNILKNLSKKRIRKRLKNKRRTKR